MRSGLRFRVYLRGAMVLEEWVDARIDSATVMDMAQRHVKAATQTAGPWMVEAWDPGAPPREAYVRFGTDPDGMVDTAPHRT